VFASIIMMLIGCAHIIAGFAALVEDEFYVLGQEYAFKFDVTAWGWIHLILGIVVVAAAAYLFRGAVWARTVGVIAAAISILASFAWLPWYPVWAVVIIAMGIAVIWALTVHGRDLADI
jgi:hypothetical protein